MFVQYVENVAPNIELNPQHEKFCLSILMKLGKTEYFKIIESGVIYCFTYVNFCSHTECRLSNPSGHSKYAHEGRTEMRGIGPVFSMPGITNLLQTSSDSYEKWKCYSKVLRKRLILNELEQLI